MYPEKEGFSGEELESLRRGRMNEEAFFIVKNDDGSYALQRYDYIEMANNDHFAEINENQINSASFETVVFEAMKKHRSYDRFHDNGILTATGIKKALDLTTSSIIGKKEISMKQVVTNAIANGISNEDVETVQKNSESPKESYVSETSIGE